MIPVLVVVCAAVLATVASGWGLGRYLARLEYLERHPDDRRRRAAAAAAALASRRPRRARRPVARPRLAPGPPVVEASRFIPMPAPAPRATRTPGGRLVHGR